MGGICGYCHSERLELAYGGSDACASSAVLCTCCGLVQTPLAEPGSGCGFESFRTSREFRAAAAIEPIGFHADLTAPLQILDLGAGRGAFVREILSAATRAHVTAVEPDPRRAWGCAFGVRSEIVIAPLEQAGLPRESFDIAYSAAFEYLPSSTAVLAELWRALRPGGLLVLDTRNIAGLREEAALEEWFVPGLRRYFSERTLSRFVESAGFCIVERADPSDRENLLIAAVKTDRAVRDARPDVFEVSSARALIAYYKAVRARNFSALQSVSEKLSRLAPRGVAVWGGGTLLESLTRYCGLDPAIFTAHLAADATAEIAAGDLETLAEKRPGVILVMSDARAAEIGGIAARYAPESEIVHYSDLVLGAYRQLAA